MEEWMIKFYGDDKFVMSRVVEKDTPIPRIGDAVWIPDSKINYGNRISDVHVDYIKKEVRVYFDLPRM